MCKKERTNQNIVALSDLWLAPDNTNVASLASMHGEEEMREEISMSG